MATIVVRNVGESTRDALKARAASHGRSMEAEARAILSDAVVERPDWVSGWLAASERFRSEFGGIDPEEWSVGRSKPRPFSFDEE